MFSSTVTPPEMLWVSMALATMLGHLYGIMDGTRDRRALVRLGQNGLLDFAAKGQIWISSILALVQCRELYFGIRALFAPSGSFEMTREDIIHILFLFLGQALLLSVSIGTIWFRRRLREMQVHQREQDAHP